MSPCTCSSGTTLWWVRGDELGAVGWWTGGGRGGVFGMQGGAALIVHNAALSQAACDCLNLPPLLLFIPLH